MDIMLGNSVVVGGMGSSPNIYTHTTMVNPSGLTIFKNALAARNTRPARMVFLGSSTTYGLNAEPRESQRYPAKTLRAIQKAYPSSSGVVADLENVGYGFPTLDPTLGVQGYVNGAGGTTTATYLPPLTLSFTRWQCPDIVVHMIGVNDLMVDNLTGPAYKARLMTALNTLDDEMAAASYPTCHLLVQTFRPWNKTVAQWAPYATAQSEIASSSSNVAFLDLSGYFEILRDPTNPYKVISPDALHPSNNGHSALAHLISNAILKAVA